ncbi:MAG: carbon-nitrogen hydrolase family protein [Sphingomonadaceae bacterium]|nr:carbon-nitrogen hydrolase family protein [Sphingomonadaceae bacterium]
MARIALLQMTSGILPAENGDVLARAAQTAAEGDAQMLFAPEMAGLLDRDRARAAAHIADFAGNPYYAAVVAAARKNHLWIHAGSIPHAGADGKWRNRSFVVDDQGECAAIYDKIHLFDVDLASGESWRESNAYAAGECAAMVDTPVGKLGLTICYDLRFGELFHAYARAGAELITVPAAFTRPTGEAHWEILLRARAIESGAWVIAPAQCGNHADGRATWGHSMIIDPWGRVVHDSGEHNGVAIVDVDLALVANARAQIPQLQHRRPFALP